MAARIRRKTGWWASHFTTEALTQGQVNALTLVSLTADNVPSESVTVTRIVLKVFFGHAPEEITDSVDVMYYWGIYCMDPSFTGSMDPQTELDSEHWLRTGLERQHFGQMATGSSGSMAGGTGSFAPISASGAYPRLAEIDLDTRVMRKMEKPCDLVFVVKPQLLVNPAEGDTYVQALTSRVLLKYT